MDLSTDPDGSRLKFRCMHGSILLDISQQEDLTVGGDVQAEANLNSLLMQTSQQLLDFNTTGLPSAAWMLESASHT